MLALYLSIVVWHIFNQFSKVAYMLIVLLKTGNICLK